MFALFFLHLFCSSNAQTVNLPTAMVLTASVNSAPINCQDTCDAIGLRCMHDDMPLKTFNENFVKEWFYITGLGSGCDKTTGGWDTVARAAANSQHPAATVPKPLNTNSKCLGWKQPTVTSEPSTCLALTDTTTNNRRLCYCSDTGMQAGKMSKDWTQLTSTYVKAMKFQNSSLFQWSGAEKLCHANFSATLPSIRSQAENDELLAFARAKFGDSGLIWLNWNGNGWADNGMPLPSFQNWATKPTTFASNVAAMNLVDGRWVYLASAATNTAYVVCRLLDFYRWTTTAVSEPPSFTQKSNTKIATGYDTFSLADYNMTSSAFDCVKLCSKNIQCMSATYQAIGGKCRLFPIYTPSRALYSTYNITEANADYTLFDRVISKYLL